VPDEAQNQSKAAGAEWTGAVDTPREHEEHQEPALQQQAPAAVDLDVSCETHEHPRVWVPTVRAVVLFYAIRKQTNERGTWSGVQRQLQRVTGYGQRNVQYAESELADERLLEKDRKGNTWVYRVPMHVDVYTDAPEAPQSGRQVIREAGSGASIDRSRAVECASAFDVTDDARGAALGTALESEAAAAAGAAGDACASALPPSNAGPLIPPPSSRAAAAPAAPTAAAHSPEPNRATSMRAIPPGLSLAEQRVWAGLVVYRIKPQDDEVLSTIAQLGPYQASAFWWRIDRHHRKPPASSNWEFVGLCLQDSIDDYPDEVEFTFDERGPPAEGVRVEGEVGDTTPTPHDAPSTAPTPAGLREPTHVEAKAVLVSEMRAAPRPLVELNVPPLPGRDGLVRAGRGLGRALVQGAAEVLRGQRRRRARDPRGGQS